MGEPETGGRRMKWYKRDPNAALAGMVGLNGDERGYYNTLIDLLYARDGDVTDELVVKAMACNPRSWRAVKKRLVEKGKVWTTADGKLMTKRVESELCDAKEFSQEQSKRARARWHSTSIRPPFDPRMEAERTPNQGRNRGRHKQNQTVANAIGGNASTSTSRSIEDIESSIASPPLAATAATAKKPSARTRKKTTLPADWNPVIAMEDSAEFDRFRDYAKANGKTYADWDAAWRNWKSSPYRNKGGGGNYRPTYKDKRQEELEDVKRALKDSIARDDDARESDQDDGTSDWLVRFPNRSRP
jgi:uncharacterized protein YdaU (DUF1376 family)